VGLVGYLTPHTKIISNSGDVIFTDEVEALRAEVAALQSQGVNIIIAIGHSGYERDLEVARAVPGIDVIVGGHSHFFLYSPTDSAPNPSTNTIRGPYPTLVEHPDTTPTLVLQAYAFTKYLGHVKLQFNDNGGLETWSGAPILLDSSFEKDAGVEAALEPWRLQLVNFTERVVGSAAETLLISRQVESTLGNWVADSMVGAWRGKRVPGGGAVTLALINSGGIRAAIDQGNITLADLLSTFPFQNTFDVTTLVGRDLRKVLEHSAAGSGGGFLQVSGFRVTFDKRRDAGSRLVRAELRGEDGGWAPLEDDREYSVVTTDYIAGGGDGYMFDEWKTRPRELGQLDTDVLLRVLARDSPIAAKVEGRITLLTDTSAGQATAAGGTGALLMAALLLTTWL
jgi:5'-nucleotidase